MCPADRAVLRVGRARWYEEQALTHAAGIGMAFSPPEKEGADGEK